MDEALEYAVLRTSDGQPVRRTAALQTLEKFKQDKRGERPMKDQLLELQLEIEQLRRQLDLERRRHRSQMQQIQQVYLERSAAPQRRPAVENARPLAAALYGDAQGEIIPGR